LRFNVLEEWGSTVAGIPVTESAFRMADFATRTRWEGTLAEAEKYADERRAACGARVHIVLARRE
jgi:hypothetical protein